MIHGHYGAALVAKGTFAQSVSLPFLFLSTQVQDILSSILAPGLHVEETRLTYLSPYYPITLIYAPYSHSLFSTLVLGVLLGVLGANPAAIFFVVLSHFILDFITHLPDLEVCWPLKNADVCPRAGLGLWRYVQPSIALESALIVVGTAVYVLSFPTAAQRKRVVLRMLPIALLMVAATVMLPSAPMPEAMEWPVTIQACGMYAMITAYVWWVERSAGTKAEISDEGKEE